MRTFSLNEQEQQRLAEWAEGRKTVYTGPIGGRYTYMFSPMSVGVVIKVRDELTKEEIDVTDYDSW